MTTRRCLVKNEKKVLTDVWALRYSGSTMQTPPLRSCAFVALTLLATRSASAQPCAEFWDDALSTTGADAIVFALHEATVNGQARLYASGAFSSIDAVPATRVAQWDGAAWSSLGGVGPNINPLALGAYDEGAGEMLFMGGAFSSVGATPTPLIARWDGTTWSSVGGGLTGAAVRAMAVHDDGSGESLFVAGSFTNAGGVTVSNVARWNGAQWHALGAGLNGIVNALVSHDDGSGAALYAGGDFTHTGDGVTALNHIAKWDGASWSPVGAGFDDSVFALASGDVAGATTLVAGGEFLNSGAAPMARVASWNGSSWSALLGGVNATVRAATVANGGAYFAGDFLKANNETARATVRWDGSAFTAMGTGLSGSGPKVRAITRSTVAGGALVVAGDFDGAGSDTADDIARWTLCDGAGPDLTGDGDIDGADLASLLAAWNAGPGPADFNNDGDVDGSDLAALLAAWTP